MPSVKTLPPPPRPAAAAAAAVAGGMRSLHADGVTRALALALAGVTSLEEVARVTM